MKTIPEINEKIRQGQAVVVTAEEIIEIVAKKGAARAAREVDVVTTGTFSPMCSSGAYFNFGHTKPKIKAVKKAAAPVIKSVKKSAKTAVKNGLAAGA